MGTVSGHVAVELTELVGGTTLGGTHGGSNRLEGAAETGGGLSVGSTGGGRGGTTSGVDLGGQGVHVGLHGGINILGLLGEGTSEGGDLVVGLLDLLGGLSLEGKEGTVHGTDGVVELTLGSTLGGSDGTSDGSTASGVLAGSGALLGVGLGEALLGHLHGSDEVLLSLGSGGADSVEELTAHLGTSRLGGETEVLNLGGGLLGELGHLRGDTHVEGRLGLLVHVLELLLGLHHADLTLVDGTLDGSLKLHLVSLHDGGELGTATRVLHGVGTDDTSELVHLTLELLVVADNVSVESGHALGEVGLRGAELISDVETSVTGLGSELAVDLHLGLLGLGDGSVELASLLGEHVGGVRAVLLHGGTDLVELSGVVVSHGLEAGIGGSLVGLDEVLKLTVLLKVLLVTLVSDLDHAVGLGTHIGVHLGLLELVLVHGTGELGDASVGLGDLLLHGGAEKVDLGLELSLGGGDTGLGLGLSGGDVLDGLGEVAVVQGLGGVEGRSHTGSGRLKGHIGVVTVSGHLGAHTAEVSGGLGNHNLEFVVSPLASLLDLGSIDSDVLVGLGNARVDRGFVCGHGALLCLHGNAELVGGMSLVAGHTGTDELGTTDVGTVATVSKGSSTVEAALHEAHGTCEVILGLLGVHSHLVKESLLQLLASGLVESKVAVHLGTHGSNVALASGLLGSDLFLDVGKVVRQAHAAIGGVGENGASLLDIGGIHRGWATNSVHALRRSEHGLTLYIIARIGSDVHDRAAHGQATQECKGDTRTCGPRQGSCRPC